MHFQSFYRQAERDVLPALLDATRLSSAARERIAARARRLVDVMRRAAPAGGIDKFLQEYRISSPEGVVLLCLAEAFLRIPDTATVDALIRDKLTAGDWGSHIGKSGSLLVDASSISLALTGRLLSRDDAGGVMAGLVARLGEPVIRRAVRATMSIMGDQFVMGRTIEKALERSRRPDARRFRHSFDMLGEGARTEADARRYGEAYRHAIAQVGLAATGAPIEEAPGISVKLSALHPRYEPLQRNRVLMELVPTVIGLAEAARSVGIPLTIDAEEADRLELSLELFARVAAAESLRGWNGLGLAVQAYQKRALPLIHWIDELGRGLGRRIQVRLVKGAYWDTEIKRAQERGQSGYPVFTRKAATDISYLACARAMLEASHIAPAFATHNALTVATVIELAGSRRDFEFQRLHGMGAGLYETLLEDDASLHCRTYAPVGGHAELLAYLARRLLENGANSSFVYRLKDAGVSLDELIADPAEALQDAVGEPHPRIPLPARIYGSVRLNSEGIDFSDRTVVDDLHAQLTKEWQRPWSAGPIVGGRGGGAPAQTLIDPSNRDRTVGEVCAATPRDVDEACVRAAAAQFAWDDGGVARRAACLRRAADLLQARRLTFIAIAVREAGKTIVDADAEVREAVDFLRYYAALAEENFATLQLPGPTGEQNRLGLVGRGVFACISPWNFPLAIFTGQIAGALAAGNAVVAKPAPQTPIMAWTMTKLLHEAGVPPDVLHLLPGGVEIGQQVVAHTAIAGVVFTGSVGSAKAIARALAAKDGPIAPLIAETGGQNAMIVDSSALPEQVVDDVLTSAFRSAGQRCSAARILYLQEEIADKVLAMLFGAMDELAIGDPRDPSTDIGPVIDEAAFTRLKSHLNEFKDSILHRSKDSAPSGWFIAPTVIAIKHPSTLRGEIFGPVLHVIRWQPGGLGQVVDAINASGFGLTLGIHSRVAETVEFVRRHARIGNLYVNRSIIGAVVGVQPFGGEGLSGTGPKAGGPNYLRRLAVERAVSTDTTAAGGNASLMALAID